MATGKQGFVEATKPQHSVSMQREKDMRVHAPLTAMYLQTMPGLPTCTSAKPTALQDAAVIPLPMQVMCTSQTLPFLTLHIAGGATAQQQRTETPPTSSRSKSAGKHVCPHCGRDCLKPSVLEKHLRCHTGERPYPCTTCGISFKTQSNLYKHKRTQAHARLSSESGKGALSSQESTDSSRETCSSPSLELQSEESGDVNKSDSILPAATMTSFSSVQVTLAEGKTASDTEWALRKAAVVGLIASPVHGQQEIINSAGQRIQVASDAKNEAPSIHTKSPVGDGRGPLTPNRTPLQRQEALVSSHSRGKSQSHDSTDSGFSESSEQHLTSSPGDTLHESMESLPEASMELQEPGKSNEPSDVTTDDAKSKVSVQEKQKLEEHILKLISENSVLVDDKHLVNVRPRKTVLSKQGSIDLPMPYTYKDSFHFEMRSSRHQVCSSQTPQRGRVMYSSVPTQNSMSLEHAPLTRSSSLPFSVGIQNNDRTAFPNQGDSVPLSRRCSAGNICPFKSVDQHATCHRSLVRQVAVDCLSVAEELSAERGSHSSLSSDGDCGDTSAESAAKRCRRKKAQKFAYNKWYMYGAGRFKKLYSTEKDSVQKSRKTSPSVEQTESQGIQISQQKDNNSSASLNFISCSATSLPPAVSVATAQTSSQVVPSYVLLQSPSVEQTTGQMQYGLANKTDDQRSDLITETGFKSGTEEKSLIPSERKKQKTEDGLSATMEHTDTQIRQKCVLTSRNMEANMSLRDVISQSLHSVCGDVFQTSNVSTLEKHYRLNLHRQGSFSNPSTSNQTQLLFKRHSSPLFGNSISGTSGSPSASSSTSSASQAKTSFLPKYQLKIPCSTDGVSDPSISNHSSLDQSSIMLSHQSAQQCDATTNTPSTPQHQSAPIPTTRSTTSVAGTGQDATEALTHCQPNTYTPTSIFSTTPTLALLIPEDKCAIQNQCTTPTTHSEVGTSTPSVLSQPLQSVAVGTKHTMDSSLSNSPTSTKPLHISATLMGSAVHSNPATSVVTSRQQTGLTLDTQAPACQTATDNPPEISCSAFQGAQFEGKMLLVNDSPPLARDTFYVQTADLQIVMQLISDEQLALIEPQIEKQAFSKLDGSHSFLSKDPETSLADTIPAGVSQGIHKQCPGCTGTQLCVEQGNVNPNRPREIPDTTQVSVGSTDTNQAKSTKNPCNSHPQNIYLTDACHTGVVSSSGSKIVHHVSIQKDSAHLLQQQNTWLIPACEASNATRNLNLAGCCQVTDNLGATDTSIAPFTNPETSKETTSASIKENVMFFPEVPETSKRTSSGQQNSLNLITGTSNTAQGEMVQAKAETPSVSGVLQLHTALSMTAQSAQPNRSKACLLACASPATERHISAGRDLAHKVCLNPRGAFKMENSKLNQDAQQNQPCTPSQATVHLSQQPCTTLGSDVMLSNSEGITGTTASTVHMTRAHHEPDKPVSENIQKDSVECAAAPQVTDQAHDLFTGPGVGGSLQSSQLQREAGTGSQGWVPQGRESGGGDEVRVGNKCKDPKDHAKEHKTQGATETHDGYQTASEPQSHVPQPVTNVYHNTSSSAELDMPGVSGSATPALCGATSLSHDSTHVGQRVCINPDNSQHVKQSNCAKTSQLTGLAEANEMERVPLECQERFTSISKGSSSPNAVRHVQPTCGHLLAHPLLVNAIQKEVQKETEMKNSPIGQVRASQVQRSLSENKRDEPFRTLSRCNTDSSQTLNATLAQTNPPCPNRTNSDTKHSNSTCASSAHHTEPNATQCHSSGSYLEEEEGSSSSDDEGKLVIELE